jgi:hypothetical protein
MKKTQVSVDQILHRLQNRMGDLECAIINLHQNLQKLEWLIEQGNVKTEHHAAGSVRWVLGELRKKLCPGLTERVQEVEEILKKLEGNEQG